MLTGSCFYNDADGHSPCWASRPVRRLLRSCRLAVMAVSFFTPRAAWAGHSIRVTAADGFDLPVGKPNAEGYYVYRGYTPNGHQGEDWNGNGGGNTDQGDSVYSTADGVVVYSADYGRTWGNLVIVRHAFRSGGQIQTVDSLYAHLDQRSVRIYQLVKRGQRVGTIGTAHGIYAAHLHFEIRKNLQIGPYQSSFAKDYSNYFSPRQFIAPRRTLDGGDSVVIPVDTFAGQGGLVPENPPPKDPTLAGNTKKPTDPVDPVRRDIPVRDPKELARDAEAARQRREADLRKLIEEHRKKVEAMREEDMDAFWSRVRSKLGRK